LKIHYTCDVVENLGDRWIKYLDEKLSEIKRLVPSKAWNIMKTTEIYVNDEYFYNGKEENNAVAHWHKGWLEPNGNMGIKEGHMEIYNMKNIMDGYDIQ